MKKYIGTKQIEAEPMTMGEAYDKGACIYNNDGRCDSWDHICIPEDVNTNYAVID